jgi:hypothetical protein
MRHLFGLIRKRIAASSERAYLIEKALQWPMVRALFGGVYGARSLHFALRAFITLHLLRLRERGWFSYRGVITPSITGTQNPPM